IKQPKRSLAVVKGGPTKYRSADVIYVNKNLKEAGSSNPALRPNMEKKSLPNKPARSRPWNSLVMNKVTIQYRRLMKPLDVLNLEHFSGPVRDRYSATLVCNYLRFRGLNVREACTFHGLDLIHRLKPRLLFMSNSMGAPINPQLVAYARAKNIPCLVLVSEGNFHESPEWLLPQYWGWNKTRELQENRQLLWSKRSLGIILRHEPQLASRLRVSGAADFDAYTIRTFSSREAFLQRRRAGSWSKIIGVGGWNFGRFMTEDPHYHAACKLFGPAQVDRFREDGQRFNQILHAVIAAHPTVLFVLKLHPGLRVRDRLLGSAFQGLDRYENTLFIRQEEAVGQCLAVSDFWMTYESTTEVEAWLLNRPTCLINPSGTDFPRNILFKGSPNFATETAVNEAIRSFYERGTLPGFEALDHERRRITADVTEWHDGLNHVRAGNEIIGLLEGASPTAPPKDRLHQWARRWFREAAMVLIPNFMGRFTRFEGICSVKKNFSQSQLDAFAADLYEKQVAFYRAQGHDLDTLGRIRVTS
ncbi:MAG: hypothetical protein AAF492_13795, partial [Verrucomicrobiota bacterium]